MRFKNQEEVRIKFFDEMIESDVIIICDWVMKFLLRKFCEGQEDWFGKRGINWYVVVILSKRIGVFQIIIYIYIFFFQVVQDFIVIVYCICDVVKDVMMINLVIENIYVFIDNVGCYKSILILVILKKEFKENIIFFNFCEV